MQRATDPIRKACALALAVILFATGCATRGPGTGPVPPPLDMNRPQWEEQFELLRQREYQLPAAEEYVVGPGDILGLVMVGRPDILGFAADEEEKVFKIHVTEDPFVVLPHIGLLRAHGKTRIDLQNDIKAAYSTVISDPMPIITVERYHYKTVSVIGSVATPGRYDLEVGDTMLDAIFKAGGVTFGSSRSGGGSGLPPARIAKVYREKATRAQRTTLSVDDLLKIFNDGQNRILPREEIIIPFDEIILGGQLSYNIPLQPNDVVYLPPAGTVSVQGPFKTPRVVFLGPGLRTLSSVVTECGGLLFRAAANVEVIRTYPDGTMESFWVDVRALAHQEVPDLFLEDNDRIVAYRHNLRATLDFIGNFFKASATTGVNATYSP
jgi:protein involved in polysaccharide export with SLBB domain